MRWLIPVSTESPAAPGPGPAKSWAEPALPWAESAPEASGGNFLARRDGDASFYELDAKVVKDLRQAVGDVRQAQPEKKK